MKSHTISSKLGYEISAWELGDPKNPSLLMIHGMLEHGLRYADMAHFFSSQGFHVILFDLPGHGKSSGQKGHVKNFHDYAQCSLEVATHFNCKQYFVFGHSMGGLIAYELLKLNPKNIKKIIIHNPAFFINGTIEKLLIKILKPFLNLGSKFPFYIPLPCPIVAEKLVENKEIQKKIKEDKEIIKVVSPATLFGLVKTGLQVQKSSIYKHAGLSIIQSIKDPVTDGRANIAYFEKNSLKAHILDWGLHEPHNDTRREEDWSLILKVFKS